MLDILRGTPADDIFLETVLQERREYNAKEEINKKTNGENTKVNWTGIIFLQFIRKRRVTNGQAAVRGHFYPQVEFLI